MFVEFCYKFLGLLLNLIYRLVTPPLAFNIRERHRVLICNYILSVCSTCGHYFVATARQEKMNYVIGVYFLCILICAVYLYQDNYWSCFVERLQSFKGY